MRSSVRDVTCCVSLLSHWLHPLAGRCDQLLYSVAEVLAEEVGRGRTKQTPNPAQPRFVGESPHNTGGGAVQLPANQTGGARQFVCDSLDAGLQLITPRIAFAPVIAQRLHACDADGELGQPFAPRAAKTVSNDHRKRDADPLLQRPAQIHSGTVRVL